MKAATEDFRLCFPSSGKVIERFFTSVWARHPIKNGLRFLHQFRRKVAADLRIYCYMGCRRTAGLYLIHESQYAVLDSLPKV